jgi:hypothetical protein
MYFAFSRFESTRSVSEVAAMFEVSDRVVTEGIKRASTLLTAAKAKLDASSLAIDKLPSTSVVHWVRKGEAFQKTLPARFLGAKCTHFVLPP